MFPFLKASLCQISCFLQLGTIFMLNLRTIRVLTDYLTLTSLGNPSKDCQRFVDAIVLAVAPDWSKMLLNFKKTLKCHSNSAFEHQMMQGFAKLLFPNNIISVNGTLLETVH